MQSLDLRQRTLDRSWSWSARSCVIFAIVAVAIVRAGDKLGHRPTVGAASSWASLRHRAPAGDRLRYLPFFGSHPTVIWRGEAVEADVYPLISASPSQLGSSYFLRTIRSRRRRSPAELRLPLRSGQANSRLHLSLRATKERRSSYRSPFFTSGT